MPVTSDAYRVLAPALVRKAERILRSREDATDLVHGLFVDLISQRATSLELPYLYRAVTNRCFNFARDQSNRARLLEREAAIAPLARARCDEMVISAELLARLVERLDDGHVDVLLCRYFDDMTQNEIGEHLGLRRKTIGRRLARIREVVVALDAASEVVS